MMTESKLADILKQQIVLPLFYHKDRAFCIDVVNVFYDAGIRMVEFNNRGKAALHNFRAIAEECKNTMPGMMLAAGTIKTKDEVRDFTDAGAHLLISPFFDEELHLEAKRYDRLWIPGVMTVRELHMAYKAGRHVLKLFPGDLLTPAFVKAVSPLFENTRFLVTGGVEPTQAGISLWIDSGVTAVGLGSKLLTREIADNKDLKSLKRCMDNITEYVNKIQHKNSK